MQIIRLQSNNNGRMQKDTVEMDVAVPLYTILTDELKEFMEDYPETLHDEDGDEYKTSLGEVLNDYILKQLDEEEVIQFYVGKGGDTKYYKLHFSHSNYRTVENAHKLVFSYCWWVDTEAPF